MLVSSQLLIGTAYMMESKILGSSQVYDATTSPHSIVLAHTFPGQTLKPCNLADVPSEVDS